MAPTPTVHPCREHDEEESEGELRPEVACVAFRELREDSATREDALRQMREWLSQNRDVHNCRTDSNFLLRFLRAKKFSVPMAQQMLLKYLNLRQCFSHLLMNLDPQESILAEILESGYVFASPFRDSVGRRVLFYMTRQIDPKRHTREHMASAQMLAVEVLLENPDTQVLGVVHVVDLEKLSASHVTMWPITEFATIVKWGEQSVPLRHKQIHVINMPTPLRYVFDFAQSRLSSKMRGRINVYDSLEHLHSNVDPKLLPKEYGGIMPLAEMIALWRQEIAPKRERLLALDNMQLLSDQGIITRHSHVKTGVTELAGSFRRLEVD